MDHKKKELRDLSQNRNSLVGVHDPFVGHTHDLVVVALERQNRSGSKGGRGSIGIRFKQNQDGTFLICNVAKGGAASKSGQVQVGDILRDVSGVDVRGLIMRDVMRLTKGPPGTTVIISLERSSTWTAAARNIFPVSSQTNESPASGESNAVFATRAKTVSPPDTTSKRNVVPTERTLPSPHGMLLDDEEETGTSSSDTDSAEFDSVSPELRRSEHQTSSVEASPAKASSIRSSSHPDNKVSVWNVTVRRKSDARERSGVGLVLGKADDDCFICTRTLPGSAAAQLVHDGIIAPGDRIVAIDGSAVKGKSLDEAVDMLRGGPGTLVQITIHRRDIVQQNVGAVQQWPAQRPQQRAAERNHVTLSSKPSAVWVDPEEENRKHEQEKRDQKPAKSSRSKSKKMDPPWQIPPDGLEAAHNAKPAVLVEPVHGLALEKWGGRGANSGGGGERNEISAEEEDSAESLEEMRRQLLVLTTSLGAAVKEVRDVRAGKARAVQEGREKVSVMQELVEDLKLQSEELRRELSGRERPIETSLEKGEGARERERMREKERDEADEQARSLLAQVRQLLRENKDLREANHEAYDVLKVQEEQILLLKEKGAGSVVECSGDEAEREREWEEREREWERAQEGERERERATGQELRRMREELSLCHQREEEREEEMMRLKMELEEREREVKRVALEAEREREEKEGLELLLSEAERGRALAVSPTLSAAAARASTSTNTAEDISTEFLRQSLAELSQQHSSQLSQLRAQLAQAAQKLALAEANGFLPDAPPPPHPLSSASPHRRSPPPPSPPASFPHRSRPPPPPAASSSSHPLAKPRLSPPTSPPPRPPAHHPPSPTQSPSILSRAWEGEGRGREGEEERSSQLPATRPSYPSTDVTLDKSGTGRENSLHHVHGRVGPLSLARNNTRGGEGEEGGQERRDGRTEREREAVSSSPEQTPPPVSLQRNDRKFSSLSPPPRSQRRPSLEPIGEGSDVDWEARRRIEEAQQAEIERAERQSALAKRELLRAIQSAETAVKNSQRSLVSTTGRC